MSSSNSSTPGDTASGEDRLVLTSAHRVGRAADDVLVLDPEAAVRQGHDVRPDDRRDDAALRALVAEIVREELRGPLGERMTRNLRKLVRREVSRALAMRDVG